MYPFLELSIGRETSTVRYHSLGVEEGQTRDISAKGINHHRHCEDKPVSIEEGLCLGSSTAESVSS